MGRALVLNASYEPLSVVSARRAVVLLVRDKAELIHSRDTVWHSETMEVPVPTVIRLRRYVKVPYRRRIPLTRRAVFARDSHACQYCGSGAENLDHVLPRSRGGEHTWENVVAACRPCNTRKGDRTPDEADMRLTAPPTAPHRNGWLLIGLGTTPHPSWNEYLQMAG
jgi:5-methylcytosine-specific restriction endonuclease McrA